MYVQAEKLLLVASDAATAVTAARFGSHFAKLGKDADWNDAWIGMTLAELSAKGPQQPALRAGSDNDQGNSELGRKPRPGRC